jgi:histidyl-tRNA synthetase
MKKGPDTPKGFRDIDPKLAKKRRRAVNVIADTAEEFGFVPLETSTVERADTLLGKYGEEEKLIYQFEDRGGRKLALRYDLTVSFARYVANNLGVLSPTFSAYRTGQVFRGEKPQAGRYREFTQFDFDVVGTKNLEDDARVIATTLAATRKLGLSKAKMAINDRKNFEGVPTDFVRTIDKMYKIGIEGVKKELAEKGYSKEEIQKVDDFENEKPTENLVSIFKILNDKYGLKENKDFFFDPTLARGLDYYTGSIFELKPEGNPEDQSIAGGGRYDNLIGMFAGRKIPAVGISFGFDRLVELI